MKTAYVVTQGEYSEYRILGVYTTEELASRVAGLREGRVEAFELDQTIDAPAGMYYYYVRMGFDGENARASISDPISEFSGVGQNTEPRYTMFGGISRHCWASSAEHAIKMLNDKRIQMMASGEIDAMRKQDEHEMRSYNSRSLGVYITKTGWTVKKPEDCSPESKDPVERVLAGDFLNQQKPAKA